MSGTQIALAGLAAAIIGALVGAVGVWYGRRQDRTSRNMSLLEQREDAREEAESLAQTRGQMIADLRRDLDAVVEEQRAERAECERRLGEIRSDLERIAGEAADTQRLLLGGIRNVISQALVHLENTPPGVDDAVAFLREQLTAEPPARRHIRRVT